MRLADIEGPPCSCPSCFQAGMTEKPQRRDPRSGEWLHGDALRRWYAARDEFLQQAKRFGIQPTDVGGR